jgi:hypothetical protein
MSEPQVWAQAGRVQWQARPRAWPRRSWGCSGVVWFPPASARVPRPPAREQMSALRRQGQMEQMPVREQVQELALARAPVQQSVRTAATSQGHQQARCSSRQALHSAMQPSWEAIYMNQQNARSEEVGGDVPQTRIRAAA